MKLEPNLERMREYAIDVRGCDRPREEIFQNIAKFFGCEYFQPASRWCRDGYPYLHVSKDRVDTKHYSFSGLGSQNTYLNYLKYSWMIDMLDADRRAKKLPKPENKFQEELL